MNRICVFAGVLITILASESCSLNINGSGTSTATAFKIIHLSPDQGGLDIYIGGNLTVSDLTYTNSSTYFTTTAGTYNFLADAANTNTQVINTQVDLASNVYNSIFIIDSAFAISTAVVQDTITPSADSAKIRILDLAPIGDTVNIAYVNVNGGTSVVSYSRSFNDQANNISYAHFISIPVGTYTFSVTQTGTTNSFPLEGTSQTQAFSADKVYTLALSGFLNTNFNSESLQLVNIENY